MPIILRCFRAMLLMLVIFAMQGCFTPAHMAGMEYADSLEREFVLFPPPQMRFGIYPLMPRRVSATPGYWHGVSHRQGRTFDEYQFGSVLRSEDDNRCLRILLPTGSQESTPVAAILEEFEGTPEGIEKAWLYAAGHHLDPADENFSQLMGAEDDDAGKARIVSLAVHERGVSWMAGPPGDRVVRHAPFVDQLRWHERSSGEVILRLVTIPVAMLGDAALVTGVVVGAPIYAVSQWLDGLGR